MEVFRITQEQFSDDLTGNGSRLFGGRWNSEGLFAVYVSSSRSLALLETLAHLPPKMLDVKVYNLITISISSDVFSEEISLTSLADGWDAPEAQLYTKGIGDRFLRNNKALMLSVPSVMIPEERNYVLNPLHNRMKKVKIVNKRRVHFDKRLKEKF